MFRVFILTLKKVLQLGRTKVTAEPFYSDISGLTYPRKYLKNIKKSDWFIKRIQKMFSLSKTLLKNE